MEIPAALWRLVADCAIATAVATSHSELVGGLARVLRLELGVTDVGYVSRHRGVWAMAAASGGDVWPNVLVYILQRTCGRGGMSVRIGTSHVFIAPVYAGGEVHGYLAVTSNVALNDTSQRLVREMLAHVGSVIATLHERVAAATPSSSAVTTRLPRFIVDN